MKTISEYLDEIKRVKKINTDKAIGEELGITKASISHIRKGGGVRKETADKIVKILNVTKEEVYLSSQIDKTQDPVEKRVWIQIAKKFEGVAAVTLIGTALPSFLASAQSILC